LAAFIDAISTATDMAMLKTKNASSMKAGMGITISTMMVRMPTGRAMACGLRVENRRPITTPST
jgi:hypothetical protein